jgi:hypothetical protein
MNATSSTSILKDNLSPTPQPSTIIRNHSTLQQFIITIQIKPIHTINSHNITSLHHITSTQHNIRASPHLHRPTASQHIPTTHSVVHLPRPTRLQTKGKKINLFHNSQRFKFARLHSMLLVIANKAEHTYPKNWRSSASIGTLRKHGLQARIQGSRRLSAMQRWISVVFNGQARHEHLGTAPMRDPTWRLKTIKRLRLNNASSPPEHNKSTIQSSAPGPSSVP